MSSYTNWDAVIKQFRSRAFRTEYGPWRCRWIYWPQRTIGGRTIWWTWCYQRSVYRWRWDKRSFARIEFADAFEILKAVPEEQ